MAKGYARTFGQDLMRGEHKVGANAKGREILHVRGAAGTSPTLCQAGGGNVTSAIPGGGTGKNAAYMFATDKGYAAGEEAQATGSGTSIFDPVLCELAYRWFCPPSGTILDPFAGGSVRGIVASKLGRQYIGCELRAEQVAANQLQADEICDDPKPVWHNIDSRNIAKACKDVRADFIFSCPPYADLEVYSDDPKDLSTLAYAEFREAYAHIIKETCSVLKPDRFACFVVGDVRDKKGFYYGFPWHTIQAFEDAGLRLYNEAVLVTAVGSLPIRVGKQFQSSRKLGKTHQNIVIFCKGDPSKATKAIGDVDFAEPEAEPATAEAAIEGVTEL